MRIVIKIIIMLTDGHNVETELLFEWIISPSYVSLAEDIDDCIQKMSEELRVATWKAFSAGLKIFQIKLLVDEKPVNQTGLWTYQSGKIDPDKLEEIDRDIISSILSFTNINGPKIAFEVIHTKKFREQ